MDIASKREVEAEEEDALPLRASFAIQPLQLLADVRSSLDSYSLFLLFRSLSVFALYSFPPAFVDCGSIEVQPDFLSPYLILASILHQMAIALGNRGMETSGSYPLRQLLVLVPPVEHVFLDASQHSVDEQPHASSVGESMRSIRMDECLDVDTSVAQVDADASQLSNCVVTDSLTTNSVALE